MPLFPNFLQLWLIKTGTQIPLINIKITDAMSQIGCNSGPFKDFRYAKANYIS
jgi:hypothetical protein